MKKIYLKLVCFSLFQTCNLYAQVSTFPYVNDLKGPNPVDVVAAGDSQTFTNNGVQLTSAENSQRGAIVLNSTSFTSDQGITVEFEYDMYDGNPRDGFYADGICFFLYDASTPLINLIGAPGGALSYAYNRNNLNYEGLNGAYLGIGFDAWYNFAGRNDFTIGLIDGFANNGLSRVTLRGAMRHTPIGADAVTQDDVPTSNISNDPNIYNNPRFQGYPVLYSRSTLNGGTSLQGQYLDLVNNNENSVNYVNINTPIANTFYLRGGELNPSLGSNNYRKAIITLGPAGTDSVPDGYYITIDLFQGGNLVRIIDKYHYKERFYYAENANTRSNAYPKLYSKNYELEASPPEHFKIGFAASTGGVTQINLVKNLVVDLAYTPRFEPDYVMFCKNVAEPSYLVIDVFANDFVYNGPIYGPPIEGNTADDIDYSSFKFTDGDTMPYAELGSWIGDDLVYVDPNEGTWSFSKITGKVTFSPAINFNGKAMIFYKAKGTASLGGPFAQDEYYSVPDEIVVEEIKCGGFINPQLPSKSQTNFLTN